MSLLRLYILDRESFYSEREGISALCPRCLKVYIVYIYIDIYKIFIYRSVSICIAYLIFKRKYTYDEAFNLVISLYN